MQENSNGRLVIVSNRLPLTIVKDDEGDLKVVPGSGGLVTALAPVLKNRGGLWIGWPGPSQETNPEEIKELLAKENRSGFILHPVFLSKEEIKLYYEGFANEIIWPLFHDLPSDCNFDPAYWRSLQEVNKKFAEETCKKINPQDFIWIHDYHLILVGQEIRKINANEKLAFFLHIPFPSLDIFTKLPWRFQILRALLEYDLLGFQTLRDQRNFIQCVKRLLPEIKMTYKGRVHVCHTQSRQVRVGAFPISIDFQEFSKMAEDKFVTNKAALKQEQFKGQKIVFSCDRLDISKGIPNRLKAICHLLKTHPELHKKVTFFQLVIPSRIEIEKYQNLKNEIDRLVGEINSQYTQAGWIPIHYLYQSMSREELVSFYRISDIALITSLKDGMNLVAKEYVASNISEKGILILSEFAGTASQFQDEALLINPYDIEGLADTIYNALMLPPMDTKKRMKKMRRNTQHYDVFWWVRTFLTMAISKELHDFPIIGEYTPTEDVVYTDQESLNRMVSDKVAT